MRLAGMLDGIAGVLLGGFHSDGRDASRAVAKLLQVHLPKEVPIVGRCNFGHFWPAAGFPVARPVRLVAGAEGLLQIQVDWAGMNRAKAT